MLSSECRSAKTALFHEVVQIDKCTLKKVQMDGAHGADSARVSTLAQAGHVHSLEGRGETKTCREARTQRAEVQTA